MRTGDSGEKYKSDDPLPDGWSVKVKSTTGGKKYKCYFPPSGEGRFYSKLEVVRFLNKNNPESEEKEDEKDFNKRYSKKFVVEKSEPDELPPGWIKEIKVTKKGDRIRRDPYYTDPVSGYIFRSMKGARRYLETGKVGRLALKPKDTGIDNVEVKDDEACESDAAKKQKLVVDGTASPLIGDELVAASDNIEGPAERETARKNDCNRTGVGDPSSERTLERGMKDEVAKTEHGKFKKRKDLNLPRRASKRLAGLPLEPSPELKTTNRIPRAVVKELNNTVASVEESSSHVEQEAKLASGALKTKQKLESDKGKHPIRDIRAPSEAQIENQDSEEHAEKIGSDDNADWKPEVPLDLPVGEFWQDPCIAFAIRTLTGIPLEHSESIQLSSGSNNVEFWGLTTLEDSARKEDFESIRPQTKPVQHLSNLTSPVEHPGILEIDCKEKPRSPINTPFADAWSDPCIEFAIKTLTGAIPLDSEMIIQDYVQHKTSSSQSQESSGLTLQNMVEPGQTETFYQQYSISERPMYNGEALPHTKGMNLG